MSSDYYGAIAGELADQGAADDDHDDHPRCTDPDCDGPLGHDGPHYQWIPE